MADNKILQTLLDGQVRTNEALERVEKKIEEVKEDLDNRIDKLGLQIANLEDDAPTVEEFGQLKKRVEKLENRAIASA